ncbi:hypothetical protein SAMN05444273_101454 [Litoreibacter ascidiaceicola]|uniref:Muramidase (Phage lambda lysozyme) n=1 Tax=Litoreibacter ascidiaceicola TaxID=1486859 RepID=A0A1M4TL10_9RHOB|nr:hypothetical protein [Litoreibacter ascidiaceicola]SHE45169.1 hypothetical protein SAMN05444273_101454 [Litoreibacter ascidiaceicola]
MNRRALLLGLLASTARPAFGQSARYELENSLTERAKWRSFGNKDWITGDPIERARSGRARITTYELTHVGGNSPVARLKSLIALAEAGPKGYDAVHVGASVKPPKRPTQMSLGQILAWIKRTPGQPHAIGRYQFIPSTLRVLIARAGLSTKARFSPEVQDQLADLLLADAGLAKFQAGRMSRKRFMNNLARIWAGLPTSSGKSYYDGYAGNRATLTRAYFDARMREFFPKA